MRSRLVTLFAALPLLIACGGGSSDPNPALQTAALTGAVIELDGQTVDRSGVRVEVVETGQSLVTGADGRFSFTGVPAGDFTLQFSDGARLRLAAEGADDPAGVDDSSGSGSSSDDLTDDMEDELEDADDDSGSPRLFDVGDDDDVEVRVVLENGEVVEFKRRSDSRMESRSRLTRASGSPDGDVEGKVKLRSETDRQKFQVEAEHLDPGTEVAFYLDDPSTDGEGFLSIGTMTADVDGEAELEFDTNDGDALPLGASSVAELEGFLVEVRLASDGALLLTGTVPSLPTSVTPAGGTPLPGEEARGKARLAAVGGIWEGHIEIRTDDDGEQEFEMEAERLDPGSEVTFQIEDPDNAGTFVDLATRTAGSDGEAEYEIEDGDALPLGVDSVSDLIGLDVRVVDGDGTVILTGTVPGLVVD
jgi:hypothetical protein